MNYKKFAFSEIEAKINAPEVKKLSSLWDTLSEDIFPIAKAPFPVSHGDDHIANVIVKISNLIDAISLDRVSEQFNKNQYFLFCAGLIHDIYMSIAPLDTEHGVDNARKQHADFDLIKELITDMESSTIFANGNLDLICLLASSHATSYDKNGIIISVEEKVEHLEMKYKSDFPDILLYSRILQFADLLDIREDRLNNFKPSIFKKKQYKHYLKHKLFSTKIDFNDKKIIVELNDKPISLSQIEVENLRKEVCYDINNQFEKLRSYFHFGWILELPNTYHSNISFPTERQIRIQANHFCNLHCHNCHDDQLNNKCLPNYDRLITLIDNIKRFADDNNVHPRPNISFALTGGEPLLNTSKIKEIIHATSTPNLLNGEENSTFLLTNATLLDEQMIKTLKDKKIYKIRISINYKKNDDINYLEFEDIDVRIINIKNLINQIHEVEIRINHVLKTGDIKEIYDFVKFITNHIQLKKYIPNNIKEIGFIQDTKNGEYDLFELADEYINDKTRAGDRCEEIERNITFFQSNGFKISFIKLNCDVKDDLIKRCFSCVREQDINISADARIRICSGWDEDFNPKFQDAQFDIEYPLNGIAGLIRKKYGVAGFYGHFPFIIKSLSKGFSLPNLDYQDYKLRDIILKYTSDEISNEFDDTLFKIIELITNIDTPFKPLFEEGIIKKDELEETIELCILLLKALYNYSSINQSLDDKIRINKILLILSFLTVDENLFSTGRTIIIKSIAEKLLNQIVIDNIDKKNDTYKEDFLIYSTYCIATIALENIEAEKILNYINLMLNLSNQYRNCQIPYLLGCIYRQLKEKNNSINAFEQAYQLAEEAIKSNNSDWLELIKEIRVEAQRSLGAIKKNDIRQYKQTKYHFLKAHFFASNDKTALRYTALFSDGYSSMLRFFNEEYAIGNKFIQPRLGYEAYIQMKESLELNPTFYAPLTRIALLDLAYNKYGTALNHIKRAHKTFNDIGLLTDQEYLNKIMSNFIYLFIKYKIDNANIPTNILNEYSEFDIASCVNVGIRDIECIMEDMNILLKIIIQDRNNNRSIKEIKRKINEFNDDCNNLIKQKNTKKANEMDEKLKRETDQQNVIKIKKEIEQLKKYDYLEKLKIKEIKPDEFHHICIQTNDYDKSLDFYTTYLGGTILKENPGFNNRKYNTWLLIGDSKIELQTPKKNQKFREWSNLNSGPVHLCLVVKNVRQMYNQIKEIEKRKGDEINFKTKKDDKEIYEVKCKGFSIFKVIAPEGTEIEIRDNPNVD